MVRRALGTRMDLVSVTLYVCMFAVIPGTFEVNIVRVTTVKRNYCGISIRDKRKKRTKDKLNNVGKFLFHSVKSFTLTSTRGKQHCALLPLFTDSLDILLVYITSQTSFDMFTVIFFADLFNKQGRDMSHLTPLLPTSNTGCIKKN